MTSDLPIVTDSSARTAAAGVSTSGLTKVYTSGKGRTVTTITAVDHLDLSVAKGEIFGLLGPNGAGKTTTVGMLTTLVVPTGGQAMVNGVDVMAHPVSAKRFLGVVHQANTLDRRLTTWENLYFHGRYFGMSGQEAKARADELLERFQLAGRGRADVRTLSGGMARRLMLARAVIHRPAVLFLDEPTAGLDPQSRVALWDMLGQLRGEGQTIFLTTHYMEEADRFCDRVAIMDHGKILALDTPTRLKQSVTPTDGKRRVPTVSEWLDHLRALARSRDVGVDRAALERRDTESVLATVVAAADKLGVGLDDLRGEVTLETVFFELTGRELRE